MSITSPIQEFGLDNSVSAEVFSGHEDAVFWLGHVATGDNIIDQNYYNGLMRFRGNVYVRELHFLTESQLDSKGREIDEDDIRSVEFVVLEKDKSEDGVLAEVVGSTRLIMKSDDKKKLPIEHYFPEVFTDEPASKGTGEVSRFIARHHDKATQSALSLSLIRTAVLYSMKNGIDTQYFMIEEPLVRLFNAMRIPLDLMGESKYVPEYEGILYPARVHPKEIFDKITSIETGSIALKLKAHFETAASETGEGYYDASLQGVSND